MVRPASTFLFCFAATGVAAPMAAAADIHIYSYDPKSADSRLLTQTGLSFQFDQRLFGGVRVQRIMQTGDRGAADLNPASEKDLGPGGLKAALGAEKSVGELYRIEPDADGQAFINAVCPGAEKGWLVIGSLRRFSDLSVQAIGRNAGSTEARRCITMEFSFKSDWRLPERAPPRVRFTDRTFPR